MFRLWVKCWKNARLVKDTVVERPEEDTPTHKIFHSLEDACHELDLGIPIWLEKNIKEFKRSKKTRFYQDNFMESIPCDYVEIQILDED